MRYLLTTSLLALCLLVPQAVAHHPAKKLRAQHVRAAKMERVSRHAERWDRVRHWRPIRVHVKRERIRALREHRTLARAARRTARLYPPGLGVLNRIARCESGGNPRAISPSGAYRGLYQFDFATWRSVGGVGDPAAAAIGEQHYRAAILYRRRGPQPWPVCGYR
jgi:hypothetical protein